MDRQPRAGEIDNIRSIHIWGFYNSEGTPRLPQDAAPSERTVFETFLRVKANIENSKAGIDKLSVVRLIGGNFVGCTFDAFGHVDDEEVRMWHVIKRPQEEWPEKVDGLSYDH